MQYKNAIGFVIILVLLIRPSGLFGARRGMKTRPGLGNTVTAAVVLAALVLLPHILQERYFSIS
jgi:hypothetical protein